MSVLVYLHMFEHDIGRTGNRLLIPDIHIKTSKYLEARQRRTPQIWVVASSLWIAESKTHAAACPITESRVQWEVLDPATWTRTP